MPQTATKSVESLLEQGLTALDAGKFEEALTSWNKVLELDPGNVRAARLVQELRALIRDGESTNLTPASGEFVVVVDDDAPELAAAEKSSSLIARGALDRLRQFAESASERAEELERQLAERGDETLQLKSALGAKDKEVIEAREASLVLERRVTTLENERRDLERFKRQRERQASELELSLAEAKAAERKLAEDLKIASQARDELNEHLATREADLASMQSALQAETEAAKEARAAAAEAADELETLRAAVESLRSEQATAATQLEEREQTLEAQRDEITTLSNAVAEHEDAIEALDAQLASVTAERDAHAETIAGLRANLEALEQAAAESASEVERVAEQLAAAAHEAEEKITAAHDALAESQAARNAMRTEMATVVTDLDNIRTSASEFEARIAALEASLEAEREARAQAEAARDALSTSQKDVERTMEEQQAAATEAHEVAEAAVVELEAARDELVASEERAAALEAELKAARDAAAGVKELTAKLAARDQAVSVLQAAVSDRDQALAAAADGDTEAVARAQAEAAEASALARELNEKVAVLEERLANRDADAAQSVKDEAERTRDADAKMLAQQREIDAMRIRLSAAEGRARDMEAENAELQAIVAAMQSSPVIEMSVSDSYPSARSTTTPHGHIPVAVTNDSGASKVVRPPPVPAGPANTLSLGETHRVEGSPSATMERDPESIELEIDDFEDVSATPAKSSALARLTDEKLTPTERLSWLIDEAPYVSNTATAPDLSAQAAFVLQNIDGNVSFADLIDIVGLPADETAGILVELLTRGIVTSPALQP